MNPPDGSRQNWKKRGLDLAIVGALFALSFVVAYRYMSASHISAFAEFELRPAAMMACGHGFTQPSVETPMVYDFLARRRTSMTCDELTGRAPPGPPTLIALQSRYSVMAAGLALRLGSVSWRTLDAYMAALMGLSMSCIASSSTVPLRYAASSPSRARITWSD